MENIILSATVKTLSQSLKKREISSLELTKAYLNAAKLKNSQLCAFISVFEETAIEDAEKADKILLKGEGNVLTGIPLGIKDNICTRDALTTCGSKMLMEFIPPYDATAVTRLKNKGFVLLGKTNMDEFAMGSGSETSYFGKVKNPYNLKRVPGGSSGGSAAAVAANLCPAALGSDTGGSVRQPAAFCGVTGIKPTYGSVSRYGLIAFASSFDQIGPIAKTAEDCGIILNAIAGYDPEDRTTKNNLGTDYLSKIGTDLKGTVIGLPGEFFGEEIDPEVKNAVLKAAEYFKNLGCIVKKVSIPSLRYGVAAYYLISSAEAASNLSRYDGIKFGHRSSRGKTYEEIIKNTRREGFGIEVKRRIMLGNYALSSGYYDAYYSKAVKVRGKLKAEFNKVLDLCDFILTPTAPTTAYKIGENKNDPARTYAADICTVTANITGLPAISTTCGYDKFGLPIGMSLVGRAFDEATIIAAADRFERDFIRVEAKL